VFTTYYKGGPDKFTLPDKGTLPCNPVVFTVAVLAVTRFTGAY
jgi:hypothetical protein